jgi:GTPase SAR1 family protein
MVDGARNALSGYLYQFLGAAGLAARGGKMTGDQDLGAESNASAHKTVSVVHEHADMDVVLRLAAGANAIGLQFKYSPKAPPRQIELRELIEILDAFNRSSSQSKSLVFTEFVLISNRALAPAAIALYQTRHKDTPDVRLLPAAVRGQRAPKRSRKNPAGTAGRDTIARARHETLAILKTCLGVSLTVWREELRSYASQHGVLPHEFDGAFARLAGEILHRTIGEPLDLTAEFLNESLLGAADARSLAVEAGRESAHSAAKKGLSDYTSKNLVPDEQKLVRRRLIEEVEKQAALHSLVFVVGDGGSGKSVLTSEFLRNEAAQRFVAATGASDFEENWLGRLFREWRSPGHFHNFGIEPIDQVIRRLRIANHSASRPILMLDLDGIDEVAFEHRRAIRFIINHFWQATAQKTDAVLLVTSRSTGPSLERAIDDLVSEWITSDIFSGQSEKVGKVFVREFSEDELSEAARQLGEDYWSRIAPVLAPGRLGDLGSAVLGTPEALRPTAYRPADRAMVGSLRHPAMWGSFVSLPSERLHSVLNRDHGALSQLAEYFLKRFCRKTCRRRTSLVNERVFRALSAICIAMPDIPSALTRQKNWIEPTLGPLNDNEAAQLFEEAISYGLIVEDARNQWAWRHGFICDFLRGH